MCRNLRRRGFFAGAALRPHGVLALNLQEAGVDEADVVKSMAVISTRTPMPTDRGSRCCAWRIGPDGSALAMRGSVSLASGPSTVMSTPAWPAWRIAGVGGGFESYATRSLRGSHPPRGRSGGPISK
jgi:hypothetical protein